MMKDLRAGPRGGGRAEYSEDAAPLFKPDMHGGAEAHPPTPPSGRGAWSCCTSCSIARSMSLPTTMTVREATAGPVLGARAVSGVAITTSSGEKPAASAAILVKTVLAPW